MSDPVVWFEVLGKDGDKLRGFYGELFGWKYTLDSEMDYGMVEKAGEGIAGGIGTAPKGGGWVTFYVQVKDLEGALTRAERLGGEVLMPITKLPQVTLAVIADPEGHPVGLLAG